jgi:DNA-binding response OmpR family regulator/anti-sigma regulatory factor (Ser/Thr protein kinase)
MTECAVEVGLTISATAELGTVRRFREQLDAARALRTLDDGVRQNLLLAMSEIATNVVRHAEPTATTLTLSLTREGTSWLLDLFDDGGSFAGFQERIENLPDILVRDELASSGRGLALIAHFFPDFEYTPASPTTGNQNRFRLRIPAIEKDEKSIIAIVDDDAAVRHILEAYLSDSYLVRGYSDATAAIREIAENAVDLVISDISMPGMDGLALRRQLSLQADTDVLPFVFLTASEDLALQSEAAMLGIDDYIVKPVDRQKLRGIVQRVLNRSSKLHARIGNRLDERITASLKPSLPEVIGEYRAVARSRTAGAGGGDFVFHRRSTQGHTVILGDIMGHGEQAKFFAHAHAGYFHGLMRALPESSSPRDALKALSIAVDEDEVLRSTMITCLVVALESDGRVRLASAGHPRPLLQAGQNLSYLPIQGILAGLSAGSDYEELSIRLGYDERLILYTDGMFESAADNASRSVLEQSVKSGIVDAVEQNLDNAADAVMIAFDRLAGATPKDDATLLIFERDTV